MSPGETPATPRQVAESPAPGRTPHECRNCGAVLNGPYCARCGQRATEMAASLRVLARDFADEYLNVDSKILKSILALLFRPGYLTREYLQGRRVRFVRPLRLYLVSSVLFLLVLSFNQPLRDLFEDDPQEETSVGDLVRILSEDGPPGPAPPDAAAAQESEEPALAVPRTPQPVRIGPWEMDVAQRAERVRQMSPAALFDAFADGFERYLPRLMFVLLPVFALLLKLLYLRQRRFYAEHFVFALHFHAFTFVLFALLLLLPVQPWTPLLLIWLHFYFFLALKYVYHQSWLVTSVKFVLLYSFYAAALSATFAVAVVLILLLL